MEQSPSERLTGALAAGGTGAHPLYKEVKSRLTRGLAAGEWKPGEAIPSETRLAETLGVSIGTVRKAIDELVADRILLRQQGRGTFVATHTEDRFLFFFFHVVGKDGSREFPVTELLAFKRAQANSTESSQLQIESGAPVFRVQNLLKLGGRPVIFDEITIPSESFSDLDGKTLAEREGTIYGLYQSRYGVTVTRISERISAVRVPSRVATRLGLADGDPALQIRRVAHTYGDAPVEHRVSWVNTERHEYLSDLWRSPPDAGRS